MKPHPISIQRVNWKRRFERTNNSCRYVQKIGYYVQWGSIKFAKHCHADYVGSQTSTVSNSKQNFRNFSKQNKIKNYNNSSKTTHLFPRLKQWTVTGRVLPTPNDVWVRFLSLVECDSRLTCVWMKFNLMTSFTNSVGFLIEKAREFPLSAVFRDHSIALSFGWTNSCLK